MTRHNSKDTWWYQFLHGKRSMGLREVTMTEREKLREALDNLVAVCKEPDEVYQFGSESAAVEAVLDAVEALLWTAAADACCKYAPRNYTIIADNVVARLLDRSETE